MSPGVKQKEREADLLATSAEVKSDFTYRSTLTPSQGQLFLYSFLRKLQNSVKICPFLRRTAQNSTD
jgi:hypothetical protein